jgi:hypothetical protein
VTLHETKAATPVRRDGFLHRDRRSLTAVNEDAGAPSGVVGTLVSQLVDLVSPAGQVDNVTDANTGALLGIAVTAANTTNGTWFYSTNGGANPS